MISKRILVLANSTKHHPMRCVAGRELIDEGGGTSRWGGWIRPVSAHDEGALNSGERCLAGTVEPKPLDVVRVPLAAPENSPLQPENWLILKGEVWAKDSVMDAKSLLPLVEEPESLWLDPAQKRVLGSLALGFSLGNGVEVEAAEMEEDVGLESFRVTIPIGSEILTCREKRKGVRGRRKSLRCGG